MSRKIRGFTLIEMMIALLIFAVVGLMCAKGISSISLMQEKQRQVMAETSKIQMIYMLLQRDLTQAINRPVRAHNTVIPGFIAGNAVRLNNEVFELTRMGSPNPNVQQLALSSLRRVGYFLDSHQVLIRASWRNINQIMDEQPTRKILARDVKKMQVNYIDVEGNAQVSWDSKYSVNLDSTGKDWQPIKNAPGLPVAVRVILTMRNNKQFDWLFLLPGGRRFVGL